ncbi:methionine aminotransferase [Parapedobacter lycopersici]|uniref:methionine aminotransferase n=1 Tax=Parapedobacter lycopersici TaxID=1864939 RepID=UPI00333ED12F
MNSFPQFNPKLPAVGISIFSRMSALAQRYGAINLSQGFPDFDCSPKLIGLVENYMRKGYNQYAPMPGVLSLRERIAEKIAHTYGLTVDPTEEITITAGGTQALFDAIAAVVNSGDEVIVFDPAYDAYAPTVQLFGGVVRHITLLAPDFAIDWQQVARCITEKTKLIIINSPGNPSSKLLTDVDFNKLSNLIQGTGIFVLSDEVYADIVYDGRRFSSVLQYPALRDRSFVIGSFGKLFHVTGWKAGYAVAPSWLTDAFRKVHQFNVFSVNTPVQHALADFLDDQSEYEQLPAFFQEKRDFLRAAVEGTGFRLLPCEGTYFQLVDYSALSEQEEGGFSERLTREFGLATIPVAAFYTDPISQRLLRLCFAKSMHTLEAAVEKLRKIDMFYG